MTLENQLGTFVHFSDETTTDLSALIAHDFGRLPDGELSNRTVLDWMHYRARLIPARPRKVIVSPQVAAQMASYPAIHRLKNELEGGNDVSPWLSERVRTRRANPKADLMFNDWQISHFHLGDLFVRPNKIGPRHQGKPLLFAHVKADQVTFLDLQPHGSWSMKEILRILHEVTPSDLPELKGIVGSRDGELDNQKLSNLRLNGYTAPIGMDGKVFMPPGLGISASGHATRLCFHAMYFNKRVELIRRQLMSNQLPYSVQARLASSIGLPIRLGIALDAGSLVIFEKTRGIEFAVLRAFE